MNITLHKDTNSFFSMTHLAVDDTNAKLGSFFPAWVDRDEVNATYNEDKFKNINSVEYIAPTQHGINHIDNYIGIGCDFSNLKYAYALFASTHTPGLSGNICCDLNNYTGYIDEPHKFASYGDFATFEEANSLFNGQIHITSFIGDLSSLKDGYNMFCGCKQLRYFYANLPSLEFGDYMFSGCILDGPSLSKIATGINDVNLLNNPSHPEYYTSTRKDNGFKSIAIGTMLTQEEVSTYKEMLAAKGWEVQWQHNNSSSTYNLKEPSENLIILVKKIPKKNGKYKDINSEERFDLIWAHKITNPKNIDDWKIFSSIEEAMQYHQLERFEEITEN
jgi:hypothetical protein